MKKFANTHIYTGGYLADHDFDYAAPGLVQQRQEAKTFLTLLDPNAVFFTFQTFDDDKKRKDRRLAAVLHGSLAERWDELVDLNRKGAGIFVTVNETDGLGRKNSNIIQMSGLFSRMTMTASRAIIPCLLPLRCCRRPESISATGLPRTSHRNSSRP